MKKEEKQQKGKRHGVLYILLTFIQHSHTEVPFFLVWLWHLFFLLFYYTPMLVDTFFSSLFLLYTRVYLKMWAFCLFVSNMFSCFSSRWKEPHPEQKHMKLFMYSKLKRETFVNVGKLDSMCDLYPNPIYRFPFILLNIVLCIFLSFDSSHRHYILKGICFTYFSILLLSFFNTEDYLYKHLTPISVFPIFILLLFVYDDTNK